MEVKTKKKRDYTRAKLILAVSAVWVTVIAIGVSTYAYSEVRYSQGVNYGIEQTKSIYGAK